MKTQILQLEAHDDALSARDKMGWGQTGRIILVWPKHERILNRRLDLLLLKRRSLDLGAQLALVTTDPDIHTYAKELKIPVFNELSRAQSAHWRTSRRREFRVERPDPAFNRQRAIATAVTGLRKRARPEQASPAEPRIDRRLLLGGVILVALLGVFLFLPGAQITLYPATQVQTANFSVSASPNNKSPNLWGDLPARPTTVVVEGRQAISTTGKVSVPENSAAGQVSFTNLTTATVDLPSGTIVSTLYQTPVRFQTMEDASVPGGIGRVRSVRVQALTPGATGNVSRESIQAIEGPLGLKLTASNPASLSGGSDRLVRGASSQDYSQLYDRLLRTLQQTALNEMKDELGQGGMPISATLTLSNTLEKTYDPVPLSATSSPPSDRLALTLRLEFRLMVVDGEDVSAIANGILDAILPAGFSAQPGTLKIEHGESLPSKQPQVWRWQVQAQRSLVARYDERQVIQIAAGKSQAQAMLDLYKGLKLAKLPSIRMFPTWWTRLPILPFRMSIIRGG